MSESGPIPVGRMFDGPKLHVADQQGFKPEKLSLIKRTRMKVSQPEDLFSI
jgi:hypothetical protein